MINKETKSILGYNVFTGSREFFADGVTGVVDTLNPHSYMLAKKDRHFREALKTADWLIPDGVGIKYAAKILNRKVIEKIAGSDLHEIIINSLNTRKGSCFYLGSSEETLRRIKERLATEYPELRVGIYSPPFKAEFSDEDNLAMIKAVKSFSPDVLFVGMTAPKQEKWVFENREKLNVRLICPIGAVFDFYSGTVKRSGHLWINLGLEWLPRLFREPRRLWKRNFISTPLFIGHVLIEKIKLIFAGKKIENSF